MPRFMAPSGPAGEEIDHFHLNYFTPISMETAMTSAGFCRVFVGFLPGGQVCQPCCSKYALLSYICIWLVVLETAD